MNKFLLTLILLVSVSLVSNSQQLYSNYTPEGHIFNPGLTKKGNPRVLFDDINVPSAAGDSIGITKVKFGIYREANAPATTVTFYYTPLEDTATQYNSLIAIPPIKIGSIDFPANGPSAIQTTVNLGDSVNRLFSVVADTGNYYTGASTFFLGMGFSNTTGASWLFASNDVYDNDDAIWLYNADSTVKRSATYFGGNPYAAFAVEVFGKYFQRVTPITLSAFKASVQNDDVILNWKTESESNSSHFDIESSRNGTQFKSIGKVDASGNSGNSKTYNYQDKRPGEGTLYYRLKLVDKDNTFHYSAVEKVVIDSKLKSLHAVPNPVMNAVKFTWNEEGKYIFKIVDAIGKQSVTGRVQAGSNEINVSSLSKGLYFIQILDANGRMVGSERMLKQ